jgi:hypothetical protein
MKRLLITLALTSILSVPALAGDIPTVPSTQPAPDGASSAPAPSDIPTDGSAEQVSDTALSALLTVLGFLAV